jgi:hypothetical protein
MTPMQADKKQHTFRIHQEWEGPTQVIVEEGQAYALIGVDIYDARIDDPRIKACGDDLVVFGEELRPPIMRAFEIRIRLTEPSLVDADHTKAEPVLTDQARAAIEKYELDESSVVCEALSDCYYRMSDAACLKAAEPRRRAFREALGLPPPSDE